MKKIFFLLILIILAACKETTVLTKDVKTDLFSYTLTLDMDNALISNISVTNIRSELDLETPAKIITNEIINSQYVNVDNVSGVTIFSENLKENILNLMNENNIDGNLFINDSSIENKEAETLYYDEIIVGAGLSGLTAALRMREQGLDVAVIEKMPFAGGATYLSGGEMAVPLLDTVNSDPIQSFIDDMYIASDYTASYEKLSQIANTMNEVYNWLINEVGVEFSGDPYRVNGHCADRITMPIGKGRGLIDKLVLACVDVGVDFYYNAEAISLIEEDKIIGVNVKCDNDYIRFITNDKVVLATGGFAYNKLLLDRYNPGWDLSLNSTVPESSTGDGIIMAHNVGAKLVDMDKIQVFPFTNPATGLNHYLENIRTNLGAIFVDVEGNIFDNSLDRFDFSQAILSTKNKEIYQIFNEDILNQTLGYPSAKETYEQALHQKVLYKADTLDELCKMANISDKFISDYKLEGPYYLLVGRPSFHYTMGGILTNISGQVLDENGQIIEGLYAVGETVGGVFGINRLGATAISDSLVSGYLVAN